MDKNIIEAGMLLRISAGTGNYNTDKWAAIIRVVSVIRHGDKVKGMQYMTIAQRGKNHNPDFLLYKQKSIVALIHANFNEWWDVFKPKLLV